jgi:hypothetical protein
MKGPVLIEESFCCRLSQPREASGRSVRTQGDTSHAYVGYNDVGVQKRLPGVA